MKCLKCNDNASSCAIITALEKEDTQNIAVPAETIPRSSSSPSIVPDRESFRAQEKDSDMRLPEIWGSLMLPNSAHQTMADSMRRHTDMAFARVRWTNAV